jgi:hypothetical protein
MLAQYRSRGEPPPADSGLVAMIANAVAQACATLETPSCSVREVIATGTKQVAVWGHWHAARNSPAQSLIGLPVHSIVNVLPRMPRRRAVAGLEVRAPSRASCWHHAHATEGTRVPARAHPQKLKDVKRGRLMTTQEVGYRSMGAP